jgi:hypothetical protein
VSRPTLCSVHLTYFNLQGFHLLWLAFPSYSNNMLKTKLRADPLSFATTNGISVDFFSSGYLDVSVLQVCLTILCIQIAIPLRVGFPIRTPSDQSLFANSPKHFAGYHVLHRLLLPRHPPYALNNLITQP